MTTREQIEAAGGASELARKNAEAGHTEADLNDTEASDLDAMWDEMDEEGDFFDKPDLPGPEAGSEDDRDDEPRDVDD